MQVQKKIDFKLIIYDFDKLATKSNNNLLNKMKNKIELKIKNNLMTCASQCVP
jgi:hypothetical protein